MLAETSCLLQHARQNHYGIGAFNIYNIELIKLLQTAIDAMKQSVQAKITLFCSADKASTTTQ